MSLTYCESAPADVARAYLAEMVPAMREAANETFDRATEAAEAACEAAIAPAEGRLEKARAARTDARA